MTYNNTLEHIRGFVGSHYQLVIGTYDNEPWCATLYYAADDDLNIYFLTSPSTIHASHIANNPRVSVSIADSPQEPNSKKKGLQMFGLCELLTDDSDIETAIKFWTKKLNVENPNYSLEGIKNDMISGRMYKIKPKKIKFFNEDLQEEGKEQLIEL